MTTVDLFNYSVGDKIDVMSSVENDQSRDVATEGLVGILLLQLNGKSLSIRLRIQLMGVDSYGITNARIR